METLVRHEVSDPFLQRLEEPLNLFGQSRPAWMWVALVCAIVVVGAIYAAWMYVRERRTIVQNEPAGLKLLRYVLLPFFLLAAVLVPDLKGFSTLVKKGA